MTEEPARPTLEEPTLKPPPTRVERRVELALQHTASVLSSMVAIALLALVGIALVGMVVVIVRALASADFSRAVVEGLDAAFLVIILLELVHTTLARGPISSQVQEFIVVGITAGVRTGLEVVAARGEARSVVISLAINALGVLLLVGALWLIRQRLHAETVERPQSVKD